MLLHIVRFEIAYHLRRPLLYITSGLLFLLTFGAVSSDSIQIGEAIGQVHRNAPLVIVQFLTISSAVGMFLIAAFVASSILRDFELGTDELFFSKPVRKRDYLLGRFIGSLVVSLAAFVGPVLGIVLGSLMPWIDPERLGPFSVQPYVFGLLVMVLPNVLLLAAIFFTVAGITRSRLATHLAVIGALIGYLLSKLWLRDLERRVFAALLDPFGIAPIKQATQYWTIVEKNSALPEIGGLLLANRLGWTAVAVVFVLILAWRFSFTRATTKRRVKAEPQPRACSLARPGWRRPGCSRASHSSSCSPSASSTSPSRAASATGCTAPGSGQ